MPQRSAVARTARLVGSAASYLFLLIVAISALEVLMRYALGQPTIWAHELSVALAATCFVIGGPYVHAARRHITISYVYERLPLAPQAWVRLLCSLLTLVFLLFLSYATAVQGWQALQHVETTGTALNWPIPVYLKCLFALCALIMSLQTMAHVLEDVERVRRRAQQGSGP